MKSVDGVAQADVSAPVDIEMPVDTVGQADVGRLVGFWGQWMCGASGCSGAGERSEAGVAPWACEPKEADAHHIWPLELQEPVSR